MPTPANANLQYKQEIIDIVPSFSSRTSIVLIGDSYVNQELHTNPKLTSDRGAFHAINSMLGNYFDVISISGVGGETLDVTRARFQTDVIDLAPGFFWLYSGGVNDIVAARTADAMFADVEWMITTAIENGIIPIIPALPLAEGMWGDIDAATQRARLLTATSFQVRMNALSSQQGRWIYLPKMNQNITDQSYTDGITGEYLPIFKTVYDADTTHFTAAGANRVALDSIGHIQPLMRIPDVLPTHYSDAASGCWNPLMFVSGTPSSAGTLGANVTGTVPEGWHNRIVGTGSGVISQVPRTDIADGFWNQIVATGLTSASNVDFIESDPAAFQYIWHLFSDHALAPGDEIEFYFEFKVTGITGSIVSGGELNEIAAEFYIVDGANATIDILLANKNAGTNAPIFEGADYNDEIRVVSTIRYTIPVNAVKWGRVRINARARTGAAGTTDLTFSQGRCGVRKLA